MVYFSETPWLFSLAWPASIFLRVSRTEIDPWMTKVLFLASLAYEACASSSQAQQLDWQICEYWVSGTVDKRFCCKTNASWLYPVFKPAPNPGNSENWHGHSGSSTDGRSPKLRLHMSSLSWRSTPSLLFYARVLLFIWASLFFMLPAAKVPATRARRMIVDLVFIVSSLI